MNTEKAFSHAENSELYTLNVGDAMAMLTVRNLPDDVHRALRMQAALHGHSTEAEFWQVRLMS